MKIWLTSQDTRTEGQLWPIQALAAHSSGGYLSGLYRCTNSRTPFCPSMSRSHSESCKPARLSGGKFLLYVSDGLVGIWAEYTKIFHRLWRASEFVCQVGVRGSYITRVRILSRAELTMAVLHTAPCASECQQRRSD